LFLQETGFIQTFTEAPGSTIFRDMERHRPSDATPASAGHQTDGFTCFTQAQFWQCYHYLWLVKADIRKPLEYGTVLAFLLIESSKNCVLADTSLRFHPPSALPFCKTECFVHQPRWDDVVCAGGF